MQSTETRGLRPAISLASSEERKQIYRLKYDVYATELSQYQDNPDRCLRDDLDSFNTYIVAKVGGTIAGFISITPPTHSRYSIDKYFKREDFPFPLNEDVYEIRVLTVKSHLRGSALAGLLMYAAFRWIEDCGGKRIIAMGRHDVLTIYLKVGLKQLDRQVQSGCVTYHLLTADLPDLQQKATDYQRILRRFQEKIDWKLDVPFERPTTCYHGGAFFDAIGDTFDSLEKRHEIINADVLDAWFPPSPRVTQALAEHLPWIVRTSPPTHCEGMVQTIASTRSIPPESILPGAGSSSLIYPVFRQWLRPSSRVLILDPTYGEYAHILEKIIGCRVDRFSVMHAAGYVPDPIRLAQSIRRGYDLVVLVNPNSPTGQHIHRDDMMGLLRDVPSSTRIWLDETYIEYVGQSQTLEPFAIQHDNVVICKSMSKCYALSGLRAAYLCSSPDLIESLRPLMPPWSVGLAGQIGAVMALRDPSYYAACYERTHSYRSELVKRLKSETSLEVIPGVANFLLCHLPESGPTAASVVTRCRQRGLFIRDVCDMGIKMGHHAVRIAVKNEATNARMVQILSHALNEALDE